MIFIKSEREIDLMRQAGKITAAARELAGKMVRPGVTTLEIDKAVHDYIVGHGATPSFLGYNGFPGSLCISVNEEVIHGIPGKRTLKDGDLVSVDVGAFYKGFHGDCAATFVAGTASGQELELIEATEASFYKGIENARIGCRVSDISHAVEAHINKYGYGIVKKYVGHGVGSKLHEEPEVPNYGSPGRGPRLLKGMTIAVEPMVNVGTGEVKILSDKWTVVTADGELSAHYENTILITDGQPEILTAC